MTWLFKRVASAVVTYLLAVTLIFFLMRLTPGDPLARLSEDRPMPTEARQHLRELYQLDRPLVAQYRSFVLAALSGNFGASIAQNGRSVASLIMERLPATLLLGATALCLNFMVGVWIGVWQARRRGSKQDHFVTVLCLALYATPSFWLGLMLTWFFAIELHLLPTGFMHDPLLPLDASAGEKLIDLLRHLLLPAVTLSVATIGATARYQRAAMIDALELGLVRTARVKGLPESSVIWQHAWRNALGPMLALFGLWLPLLVAGSVYVESVFSWPGLGSMAWEAINTRDYPVIMGVGLLVSAMVVLGSLIADLLHRWLDPRLGDA